MDLSSKFNNKVAAKYQIYNSLFLTLPFEEITNTGVLLPVLFKECQEGFDNKLNPTDIINSFFEKHSGVKKENEKIELLFKFIQYIERQVVLFDAVEDAAVAVFSVVCKDDILARVNGEEPVPNGASVVDESVRHFLPRL